MFLFGPDYCYLSPSSVAEPLNTAGDPPGYFMLCQWMMDGSPCTPFSSDPPSFITVLWVGRLEYDYLSALQEVTSKTEKEPQRLNTLVSSSH